MDSSFAAEFVNEMPLVHHSKDGRSILYVDKSNLLYFDNLIPEGLVGVANINNHNMVHCVDTMSLGVPLWHNHKHNYNTTSSSTIKEFSFSPGQSSGNTQYLDLMSLLSSI